MSDWKIRKRKDGCSLCTHEFEEEEVFYSLLSIDPETIGREDRCVACFDQGGLQEAGQGAIYWRTRRPPEGKRRLAVDFDVVEQLFFALAEHEKERILELRYLMSLLLLRKKRLKLVRVLREGGVESMVLRRPRRTEAIAVRVFDLSEERSLQLRQELARIFEGADVEDLLTAPAPPPEVGAAAAEADPDAPEEGAGEAPEAPGGALQRDSEAEDGVQPAVDSHQPEEQAAD